jgi:succinylglutamate desuccinylase
MPASVPRGAAPDEPIPGYRRGFMAHGDPTNAASGGPPASGLDRRPARPIGEYGTGLPGPLLLVVGGMHGNEPAGILAARRVLDRLADGCLPLRGRLVAVRGNLSALEQDQRYLERDLNRIWSTKQVEQVRRGDPDRDRPEERELRELLAVLDSEMAGSYRPSVVLDLHSASADGPPFSIVSDTLQNRRLAFALPIPVILGLEEMIDGTLLDYLGSRGYAAVSVEGGRHGDPGTVDHLESVVWVALAAAKLLDPADVPDLAGHAARLRQAAAGIPPVVEVIHRYGTEDGAPFRMEPGFLNFTPVKAGRRLATLGTEEVLAPADGLLVLPRYQPQGTDGWFLGRPVGRLRQLVTAALRSLRAERLLPLLPGVRRHPTEPLSLLVDMRVARWWTVQVFRRFGYRKHRPHGDVRIFSRRPEEHVT